MLKKLFHETVTMLDQTMKKYPSAWAMYNKKLTSILLSAFDEGSKVVWTSSFGFPNELVVTFDVVPFDFDVALLPMQQPDTAVTVMTQPEGRGYSVDLCSYHRMAMGYHLQNAMPRADIMLTSSYFCDTMTKVSQTMARDYEKEAIMLDVPNEISAELVTYVSGQLRQIAEKLEHVTGQRLDMDRLRTCIR